MHKLIPLTAIALALALPAAAAAQDRGSNGRGNDDRGSASGQNRGSDDRGERGRGRGDNDDRREARGPGRVDDRRQTRRADRDDDDRSDRITVQNARTERGLIAGCPPGLAKKDNGCLPPGQARRIERNRLDDLWSAGQPDQRYRYENGYLYRSAPDGSLLGYLPVLGGALSAGNLWPSQYTAQPLADYQSRYFGLTDNLDYRYANGAVYGVDPRTQVISQVAALLTGQQFSVGQTMPAGYDVYNLPQQYRAQYADTATAQYRYNDGYVAQIDPQTQLIQAVIQLLT